MVKRLLCSLLLLAATLAPASAIPPGWQPVSIGYQQLTSLAAATALTIPAGGAIEAFIVCSGQPVMWRDDGTDPTATIGMPLATGTGFPYFANLPKIKIIQTTASATCNITYYR